MNNPIIHYDSQIDAMYIGVKEGVEEQFHEVAPGVNVELNSLGEVIGVEMLNASKMFAPYFLVHPQMKERVSFASSAS